MIDHEIRKRGIGGSEVAALYGVDPYQDAFSIWARKKGGLVSEPADDHMRVGKILEPAVLELYAHMEKRAIEYCDVTYKHPTRPYQVYSPDALAIGERRGIEAKVVFWQERALWGWDAAEIPERVLFQCWWYMSAMDYPRWDVAALLGEGLPRIYTVERLDPAAEGLMLEYVERWHARFIDGDERPPLGQSDDAARWLQKTYPTHKRPDIREATPDEALLLMQHVAVCVEQRRLKRERTGLEVQIKDAIQNREGLSWDGNRFTWRKTQDSEFMDWESLSIALLHNFVKDDQERSDIRAQYLKTKEGTRRIHVNHPLLNRKRRADAELDEVTA